MVVSGCYQTFDTAKEADMPITQDRTHILEGASGSAHKPWRPSLLIREQTPENARAGQPALYVHGATFPSANSFMFRFDGVSWADELNRAGFPAWGFDFAGFGGSERYPEMEPDEPPAGEPLCHASDAARQIERIVRYVLSATGASKVSIIAHSWGTMAAGLFASEHPEFVARLVFFGPVLRRETITDMPAFGPWRLITVEQQHKRFVEDVPAGHPPILLDRHFQTWSETYLRSDPTSGTRSPPSVKTPNGPLADVMATWSGRMKYQPAEIRRPVMVVRGEWDSLCTDEDVAGFMSSLANTSEKRDVTIARATHLMHLEESREELHRVSAEFLGQS